MIEIIGSKPEKMKDVLRPLEYFELLKENLATTKKIYVSLNVRIHVLHRAEVMLKMRNSPPASMQSIRMDIAKAEIDQYMASLEIQSLRELLVEAYSKLSKEEQAKHESPAHQN